MLEVVLFKLVLQCSKHSSDIHLITPPSSAKAIEAALLQNPHLTSLPSPKADILSPEALTQTSGTAEILRIPEVQDVITGDFLVLPCDIVCEVAGESLLEAWMVQHAGLGGVAAQSEDYNGPTMGSGGEKGGRRGGLGVWFNTKDEGSTKGEETDYIITAPLEPPLVSPPPGSLRTNIKRLVYSTSMDTQKDIIEDQKSLTIRYGIAEKYSRFSPLTTYRDAHIYLFPRWIVDMVKANETMDSISEDVVGWWAKAGWQDHLGEKLGLGRILRGRTRGHHKSSQDSVAEEEMDLGGMSTTWKTTIKTHNPEDQSIERQSEESKLDRPDPKIKLNIPPILVYVHPSDRQAPLIRRVDTAALLLYVSLRLAKLESIEEVGKALSSPFAHASKIAYPAGVAQRCTISKGDCLLADNTTVEAKSIIKESVIGAGCHVKSGAKLTRCILMDGAVVGERCELSGCILGRRVQVGKESILIDCEVQDGNVVPEETESKGEKFMVFEGLDPSDGEGEMGGEDGTTET